MLGLVATIFAWIGIGGALVHEKTQEVIVETKIKETKKWDEERKKENAKRRELEELKRAIQTVDNATSLGLIYDMNFQYKITHIMLTSESELDAKCFPDKSIFRGTEYESIIANYIDTRDFNYMLLAAFYHYDSNYIRSLICCVLNILGYCYDDDELNYYILRNVYFPMRDTLPYGLSDDLPNSRNDDYWRDKEKDYSFPWYMSGFDKYNIKNNINLSQSTRIELIREAVKNYEANR